MTTPIPASAVVALVGVGRHATEHWGRTDSNEEQVYILHSKECRDAREDLTQCEYSIALDEGIDSDDWVEFEDKPVRLEIRNGTLTPAYEEIPEAERFAPGSRVKVRRKADYPWDGNWGQEYVVEGYATADTRDHPLPYYMLETLDGMGGNAVPHVSLKQVMGAKEHAEAMKMPEPEDIASAISSALHSMFGDEISVHESQVLKTIPDPTDRGPGFEGGHPYTHGVEFYGQTGGGRRFGAIIRITALWDTD